MAQMLTNHGYGYPKAAGDRSDRTAGIGSPELTKDNSVLKLTVEDGETNMKLRQVAILIGALAFALPLAAQMGMGPRMPTLSGVWHPVVGSGASYERTTAANGEKTQMEITIVGKEDMGGKPGYWMEFTMSNPKMMGGAQMVMKQLVSVADDGVTSSRLIMQPPGQDPMEMDLNTSGRGMKQTTPANIADKAELVGTESITVPAGTFSCKHFRMKDGSGDGWISDQVSPWSLVKYQGKDSAMVLTKVITDAKDRITGTPKKFDPMEMMRKGMGQPGERPQ
jgi:hypothetical protein